MRIAYVIDSLYLGGAQKVISTLARALLQCGEHSLAVFNLNRKMDLEMVNELRNLGVLVEAFPAAWHSELADPFRFLHLVERLRHGQFDILHSHLAYANVLGTSAARLAGIPSVVTLHNGRPPEMDHNRLSGYLETRMINRHARGVIAVCQSVARAQQARFPHQQLVVIANAVFPIPPLEPAQRLQLRSQMVGDTRRTILISVGRLTPVKGYLTLLPAFARVQLQFPNAALVIVGEGDQQAELEQQIRQLELGQAVFLLGKRSDVPALLAASDLYINASLSEGLSMAILEAMSARLPVVATRVGEAPEMIRPDTGYLVEPEDVEGLASAIQRLLADPDQLAARGQNAFEYVSQVYNPFRMAQQHLELYRRVCGIPGDHFGETEPHSSAGLEREDY